MATMSVRDSSGETKDKIVKLKEFKHEQNIFYKRSESYIALHFINSKESLQEAYENIMALG